MKIAICGSGPLAIEIFFELEHLGAEVVLFAKEDAGGMIRKMMDFMPDLSMEKQFNEITTSLGRKILDIPNLSSIPTVKDYEKYLSSLIQKIPSSSWKKTKALRVQKRFLQLDEEIPRKSRLFDLFRVFYLVESIEAPSQAILTKKDSRKIEGFMDFDLVVDARGFIHHPKALGGDGLALGEQAFDGAKDVIYGMPSSAQLEKILKTTKKIVIVGSGTIAALLTIKLASWIGEHQLIIVSSEIEPFNTNKDIPQGIKKRFDSLINQVKEDYYGEELKYESLLEEFNKLEDYEKVKKTPPVKPLCGIKIIGGSNVMSVDRLSDREGIFVTVETAKFRTGEDKLQTLHTDCLIAATGYRRDTTFDRGLKTVDRFLDEDYSGRHPEPGYYTLVNSDLAAGIKQIKNIREDMLKFFEKR